MRQIAISVLSLFIALPAFADVRLPVVNIAAGGISARAAFGEPIVPTQSVTPKSTGTVASNSTKDTKKLAQDSVNVADTAARAVVPARSETLVVTADAADTGGAPAAFCLYCSAAAAGCPMPVWHVLGCANRMDAPAVHALGA